MAAAVLFAGIYLLRELHPSPADATLVLFVVPIALCALEFGERGGLAAGLVGVLLVLVWDLSQPEGAGLGPLGYASRITAFLLLGGLLGRFVTERRTLERRIARGEELSLDLLATADFSGYFRRLNPAWTPALGYSDSELRSRPFIDFVHPDDRERTRAELAKLSDQDSITNSFRNRYRSRDGSYLWLEWKARASAEEGLIYASARDVTAQQEANEAIRNHSEILERTVGERTRDLEEARLETLQRLALAAEYRDDDTHWHTERVGQTAERIARRLRLADEMVETLRRAAPLHDVGKLAVPDAILLKPGKLTAEEFRAMQAHTQTGAAILAGSRSGTLQMAEEIALTHHERWDGSGYPRALEGPQIPISGRITALADVFDAIRHERPYKQAWPLDVALEEIGRLSGSHFDPDVCDAFLAVVEEDPHFTALRSMSEKPKRHPQREDSADEASQRPGEPGAGRPRKRSEPASAPSGGEENELPTLEELAAEASRQLVTPRGLPSGTSKPADAVVLTGFLGASGRAGCRRLYLDATLKDYVEIPDGDLRHFEWAGSEQSIFGRKATVWIRREAQLEYVSSRS